MGENMVENRGAKRGDKRGDKKLRTLALWALVLHLPAVGLCFYLNRWADWFGMEQMCRLFFALWVVTEGVLFLGHELGRQPWGRRLCAMGLALFVVSWACVSWGCWFRWHGEWQPWAGVRPDNVSRVALGEAYGRMQGDLLADKPELAFIKEWDASVTLSPEEQQQAVALIMETWVKNPPRNGGVLWDDPEWLPDSEGESTERLVFYYGDDRASYVGVSFPYIGDKVAVDPEQARELESFINGLCEKYAPELAEYEASWDYFNKRFNEELDKWREENDVWV